MDGGVLGGRLGFVLADRPMATSYAPEPQYSENSSGGTITITRQTAGYFDGSGAAVDDTFDLFLIE